MGKGFCHGPAIAGITYVMRQRADTDDRSRAEGAVAADQRARAVPGTPLLSPLLLARALVRRSEVALPDVRLFAYGRHAIAAYVEGSGAPLFAPSYVCAEATALLEARRHPVRYYPVQADLTPDWAWLEDNAGEAGGVLLLVHYFGFPNAVEQAVGFAERHGWRLLEDCAHSFLTRHRGRAIGTFGDAGVYSYRKVLPLPDGAGLVVQPPAASAEPVTRERSSARAMVQGLARYAVYRIGVPMRLWTWMGNRSEAASGAADGEEPRGMSGQALRLMAALAPSFDRIASARRANYQRLADALARFSEVRLPYPELPEGACPYVLPMLLEERDGVLPALRALGIPAGTWPELPPRVAADPSFSTAHQLARHLLTLPVHQDLLPRDVSAMAAGYERVRHRATSMA